MTTGASRRSATSTSSEVWINGGYFVLRPEVFDYMRPDEELVHEPFQRLIDQGRLLMHKYDGFWAPMDTLKDRTTLEALAEGGRPPWAVWDDAETAGSRHQGSVGPASYRDALSSSG